MNSINGDSNYYEIDENIIDTTFLDKLSTSNNSRVNDISKEFIKALIDAISKIQNEFTKIGKRNGDSALAIKNNQMLEMYKIALYFA